MTLAGSVERASEGMGGLAKGLAIIEAYGVDRPHMTVAEAARAADVSRAAARRCLLTLVELGYLWQHDRLFGPTPRLLRLGRLYLDSIPLPRIAQSFLTALQERVCESVSLSILSEDRVIFIARSDPHRITSMRISTGVDLPAYCTASGRVLLAGLSEDKLKGYFQRVPLESQTPETIIDPVRLTRMIAEIRNGAIAESFNELETGLLALATPVRDSQGETIAALAVSASAARLTIDAFREAVVGPMLESAHQLEERM